ncbi:hypothetical protein M0R45_006277 [Rubus argutus]|uniref:CCHC-type domain-containing protein n=1 Tax=Rubus argutus TaxID=59490 RepID=A0AAW1YQK8_RUBAR
MASQSNQPGEIPFEDDEVIEAMSVEFDHSLDFLDLEKGIHLLGILIADEEPGMGAVKSTLVEPIRATYCVHAHGIPSNQITVSSGRKHGALLGSVLEVEDPLIVGNRGFLRLCIDLDAKKPLPTSCRLPTSLTTWKIRLQFENLKNFCYHCGRLGHMEMACKFQINPLLVSLGVVYDHNLVVEPVHKTFSTTPSFPIEFPYVPAKRDRFARRKLVGTGGDGEPLVSGGIGGIAPHNFSNRCSSLGGTLPMENVCTTPSNGNVYNTLGVPVDVGNNSLIPT